MRIGFDTRFYSRTPTGIGRYTYELCLKLLEFDDVELILFINPDSPLADDISFKNVKKITVKEKLFSISELFTLPGIIENLGLDIYHTPSFVIPFIKKVKTIVTIHDLIHIKFPEDYTFFHRIYFKYVVKKGALKAKKIITDSLHSKNDIKEWLKTDNIETVYLAVNKNFSPHVGITDIFSRYKFGRNEFFMYVGNNKPHKNLNNLIKAYSKVKEEIPGFWDLVLSCNETPELKILIKNLFLEDSVIFLNNVPEDELILLYSYSQAMICPSLYEGFGFPVLEAMSCGCPVLCSNVTSLPEIAGDAALYFNPRETEDIKKTMIKMFQNSKLREELSEKGKEQAKKFSWEKTALDTYKIYKEVINSNRQ